LLQLALRDAAPDLVHVQQADFRPLYLGLAGWNGPVVVTVHGLGALETGEYPALKRIVPANVARADAVTAPSAALAQEIETVGKGLHVEVVPNAVDHDIFAPSDGAERRTAPEQLDSSEPTALATRSTDAPRLVYVGRITEFKGAADLLEALSIVREALPQTTLTMVGPVDEKFRGDLDADGVYVHDSASREQVASFMTGADLTIVPSHYEGFGLTALESLACGTPVVATNVGGLPEIVDERVGALVPPGDPGTLAAAILELQGDSERLDRMRVTAVERAARYSWDETAAEFERVYAAAR
jgi:glycosyltransferase involved in cell wall biosynthesis